MKLQIRCKNCKEYFAMKEKEVSRMELENEMGSEFDYQCPKCLSMKVYHVNDTTAVHSTNMMMVFVGIGALLVFVNWFLFRGFVGIIFLGFPFGLYAILRQSEENKIKLYNRLRVNRDLLYIPKNKKK